jgi:hypothetical protein
MVWRWLSKSWWKHHMSVSGALAGKVATVFRFVKRDRTMTWIISAFQVKRDMT